MQRPEDITEHEWDLLSENEKEALSEPAEEPEGKPEEPPAEEKKEEPPAAEPVKEGTAPAEEPPKTEEPPAESAVEIPKVEYTQKPAAEIAPDLKAKLAAGTESLRKEFAPQFAELEKKFEDGEVTQVEYTREFAKLQEAQTDKRLELRDTIRAENDRRSAGEQKWEAEQGAFFRLYPEYDHPDASDKGNVALHGALNAQLQAIFAKTPNKDGISALMEAKAEVDKLLGRQPEKKADPRPAAERPKPGTSLAHVPAAGDGDVSAFAHLDNLKGDALEEALGKMSESQRDQYLSGR